MSILLPESLRDRAVEPGDPGYRDLRSSYTRAGSPALVLLPRTSEEVADALGFARESGRPLAVRSGGHGLGGRSTNDGGVVLDLSRMDTVRVLDADAGRVLVGPGARWGNVAARLAKDGLAISSGDHGGVGVGGLATAGGVGFLSRSYGLTIDHVRGATVALTDGRVVRTDATHEPDLLWAVRGAGDRVGVVTELEVDATHLGDVGIGHVTVELDRDGRALRRWVRHVAAAPRALTVNGWLLADHGRFVLQATAVVADDDPRVVEDLVAPLADLGVRSYGARAALAPYPALVSPAHVHGNHGQSPNVTTNALLPVLTPASARAVMDVVAHPSGPLVQLRSLGGAVNDVPPDATAFAHRAQEVMVSASLFPPHDHATLDAAFAPLRRHSAGSYKNFDTRVDEERFRAAYPGATGDRVLELQERYDAAGLLRG